MFDAPPPEPYGDGIIYIMFESGRFRCVMTGNDASDYIPDRFVAKWFNPGPSDRHGIWTERSTPEEARDALGALLDRLEESE